MSEREHFSKQVERLAASQTLHGSESLCRLLRYLARHSIDHPGTAVKEYQIATEVFGRRPDFDPQSDSTIRVQAGRLRAKLAEFYASEGAEDAIIVELPKGSYGLSFHHRPPSGAKPHPGYAHEAGPEGFPPAYISRNWLITTVGLGLALLLAVLWIVFLTANRKPVETALAGEREPVPAAFATFWKPFTSGPEEPWLIFSNAAFVGRPETGMRYYNAARDSSEVVWDHYTGVGEVLAVHELDQVFEALHRKIRVKRGSLFSLDDAKNNDLIFVGSPSENLTLMEIPGTREFVFQRQTSGPRRGDLAITNVHPGAGEPNMYLASPATSTLTEDYAVIALMHGLNSVQSVIVLAGTTTFGTQAAVEYVCRQNSVQELLSRLVISNSGEIQPFEALLRTKVARGVPVESQLIAVRERDR